MIFIVFSFLLIFSFAEAKVEVGLKFTHFYLTNWHEISSGYYNYTVFYEDYLGISAELLLTLLRDLYLRLEICELRFYTYPELGKGQSFHLLSGLDADLIYILPVGRKLSPLIYCGLNYGGYSGKSGGDMRIYPAYEFRLGPGINYRFGKDRKIFLEGQLITQYQIYEREINSADIVYSSSVYILGFPRINLGVRFPLN